MAVISGGDKLEKRLRELSRKVKKASEVKVGFLEGATYHDGTSVPFVAATNEFGAPEKGIPSRPFFRTMVAAKSHGWGEQVARLLPSNGYDSAKVLDVMGYGIEGQLRQSIKDTNSPPLAPATIAAKGFDKPLIDTGHMINSVAHEVTE